MTISQRINQLLHISSSDPGDARRRRLINILLLGVTVLTLLTLIFSLIMIVAQQFSNADEGLFIVATSVVILIGAVVIYAINRYRSGKVAGWLLIGVLIVAFFFADEPYQVVNGRSLFLFTIPIIMSSVILQPQMSFIVTALIGLIVMLVSFNINIVPNVPAILGYFIVAIVAWLSSRSLERALIDLRAINRELDQRVADRTRDLAEALVRVQAEASKNMAILDSIADGVIVFDESGEAIVANPALTNLINRPAAAITGRKLDSLMDNDVPEKDREALKIFLNGEREEEANPRIQWGPKTLSVSHAPVNDAEEEMIGNVVVFRDFTKEAELERMKSAFVSMASHELRTPLNAIIGYSDMLREQVYGPISDEQNGVIHRVNANGKRLLNLVNNLLDRARMEAGRLSMHFTQFTPANLVDEVLSTMIILAEGKNLELTSEIDENVPHIITSDPDRLQQILINLTGTAVKFTEQGSVTLRVFRPSETHWALSVSDTGIGIPEEAQQYIFDPFRQVDDPLTREHEGSGLGLAIVKQFTELLGGDIHLETEIGEGSTFTVVLPIDPPIEEEGHE